MAWVPPALYGPLAAFSLSLSLHLLSMNWSILAMVTCEEEPCSGSHKLEPCTKVGRARKKRRRGKSLACILTWTFFDGRERRGVSLKASWRYTSYGIVFSLMRPQWQKMPHGSRTFFRRKEEEKISDSIGIPRALSTPFYELSLSAVLKKSPITNDFFFSLWR